MDLPEALLKLVQAEGGLTPTIVALIFIGLYVHERRGRAADRVGYDAALAKANDSEKETLRTVIPLVQKMTGTVDLVPLLLSKIGGDK